MNYKALYRTYRPKSFDDIKGQDHIVKTMENILEYKKISHAYLLAGPRGTGKTSLARVFANALNCVHENDPKKSCHDCVKNAATNLDIIEIDAASNNGVNEMRDLREKVKYAPSNSRYKVYIVDEVHMLTKGAFNALLKTLEEPPEHAIFIFATTDPQKIPLTIISRVQRFNFRRISDTILMKQLSKIFKLEKIETTLEALDYIVKLANGGLRDALSISEQVAIYSKNNITLEAIVKVFGIASIATLKEILNNCLSGKITDLLKISNEIIEEGIDLEILVSDLMDLLKDFIIYRKTGTESLLTSVKESDFNNLNLSTEIAYEFLKLLVDSQIQIKTSEVPRQAFEILLLKLISINNEIIDHHISEGEPEKVNDISDSSIMDVLTNKHDLINNDSFNTKEISLNELDEISHELVETNIADISDTILIDTFTEKPGELEFFNNVVINKKTETVDNPSFPPYFNNPKEKNNTELLINESTKLLSVGNDQVGWNDSIDEDLLSSDSTCVNKDSYETGLLDIDLTILENKVEKMIPIIKGPNPFASDVAKTVNTEEFEKLKQQYKTKSDSFLTKSIEVEDLFAKKKSFSNDDEEVSFDITDEILKDHNSYQNKKVNQDKIKQTDSCSFGSVTDDVDKIPGSSDKKEESVYKNNVDNDFNQIEKINNYNNGTLFIQKTNSDNEVFSVTSKLDLNTFDTINIIANSDIVVLSNLKQKIETGLVIAKSQARWNSFALVLERAVLIAASENFVLFSSKEDNLVQLIEEYAKENEFKLLIESLTGRPKHIFTIIRLDFKKVKQAFRQKQLNGTLEEIRPINQPMPIKKEISVKLFQKIKE